MSLKISLGTDATGRDIYLGSKLAVAFRQGNSAELRIGTVVGEGSKNEYWYDPQTPFVEHNGRKTRPASHTRPTYVVEWSVGTGYGTPPKKSSIYKDLKRFVVIDD